MFDIVILAILVLALAAFALFIALCLAIRHEDHGPRLSPGPPTAIAAIARRVLGLTVRHPAPPALDQQPGVRLALWPTRQPPEPHRRGR
jgi:hypothetical protein